MKGLVPEQGFHGLLQRPCNVYNIAEQFQEVQLSRKSDAGERTALRVVTFNVMMDTWRGKPYVTEVGCHEERYAFVVEKLREMDADVVMLNEVTVGFLRCMCSLTSYRASSSPDHENGGPNINASGMGNLILVHRRLSLRRMFSVPLPRVDRLAVGAEIEWSGGRSLTLVSAHLSALTGNVERRAAQLAALAAAVGSCERVVIAGDLNWHVRAEEQYAPAGFKVAGFAEITFDGLVNTMHQHLWPLGFEARQMALDRFLVGSAVTARNVQVIFNRPIHEEVAVQPRQPAGFWDAVLQVPLRTLEQVGLVGPGEREAYLFPSDHFGLMCEIEMPHD